MACMRGNTSWQVPGDGRERVATVHEAVKIRAEDGRRVEATNISPFIANLPFGATCLLPPRYSCATAQGGGHPSVRMS